MSEQTLSIADLVAEILKRLPALDANRRHMLFRWLQAHHSGTCFTDANFEYCLREWFGALPVEGMNWEYHLILNEIAWWRDLDEPSLADWMCSERALEVQDHVRNDAGKK
jgi:hypothetical protein